jgi:integrase
VATALPATPAAATPPAAKPLNEAAVKALPVPEAGNKVHYFPGAIIQGKEVPRGFGVRISSGGVRSFVMNYRIKLRERRYTIGQWPDWSVLDAVKEARALRQRIDRGEDPLDEREAVAEDRTLKAVAERYLADQCGLVCDTNGKAARDAKGNWKFDASQSKIRSGKLRIRAFERWVLPILGSKQIADIKRSDVSKLLATIKDHPDGGPSIAHSVLAFVSKLLNWYAVNGHDDNFQSPIARGMSPIKPKERARERTLTDDEIRDVWITTGAALSSDIDNFPPCFARLVRTLLLTAVRRDEAGQATWREFDYLDRADVAGFVLTIPAARMKGKREHAVPLTPAVFALIGEMPKDTKECPYLFSTDGGKTAFSAYSKAKDALDNEIAKLRKAEGRDPMSAWQLSRDLRRTAKTLMARAGVRPDISERVLAHVIHGVEGTYDRYQYLPEKRDALDKLAALVDKIVNRKIEW